MPIYEFEILSAITDIEVVAVNLSIRELDRLKRLYGGRRWRKLKGRAYVRIYNGDEFWGEVHFDECHGIGRRHFKVKLPEDD